MSRPDFQKATADQKLWFNASEGRPSSAPSIVIKDSGGVTQSPAGVGNTTLVDVATTISATAAIGAEQLTLTAVTNIEAGRTYLITNALSQKERVRVVGIDVSGKIVYLDERLEYAYAASDTFVSTEFYYTLQTADVDTLGELFTAVATYAVTGADASPIRLVFDVVLYPIKCPVKTKDLKNRWPDITSQEFSEQRGEDYQRQINVAWDTVKDAIRDHSTENNKLFPSAIVDTNDLFNWMLWETALVLQEGGISVIRDFDEASEALEYINNKLETIRSRSLSTISWADIDENEVKSQDEVAPRRLDFYR